jgi:hypothetical protein
VVPVPAAPVLPALPLVPALPLMPALPLVPALPLPLVPALPPVPALPVVPAPPGLPVDAVWEPHPIVARTIGMHHHQRRRSGVREGRIGHLLGLGGPRKVSPAIDRLSTGVASRYLVAGALA